MALNLSIRERGVLLETELVPWDTEVYNFPVAQISNIMIEDFSEANAAFELLRNWINTHGIRMISCRLPHDRLNESFILEQQGFRFIEMVLHPVVENLQNIQIPSSKLQIQEAYEHEVALIQTMAERCFAYERFHVDPRLSTDLANLRYGNWVRSSSQSSSQHLLKIVDGNEIVAFFVIEHLQDNGVYWHLTAVAPEFQGRSYGRKTWLAMLGYHQVNEIERVATTISARNTRVLNLYSQLQFRFAPPEMTFHWIAE